MSLFSAALVLMAAQAAPSQTTEQPAADAMHVARWVARNGPEARAISCLAREHVDRMVLAHPRLSADERGRLAEIGRQETAVVLERVAEAVAVEYASLGMEGLNSMASYLRSDLPTENLNCVSPISLSVATLKLADMPTFNKVVRTAFCAETGKLCE